MNETDADGTVTDGGINTDHQNSSPLNKEEMIATTMMLPDNHDGNNSTNNETTINMNNVNFNKEEISFILSLIQKSREGTPSPEKGEESSPGVVNDENNSHNDESPNDTKKNNLLAEFEEPIFESKSLPEDTFSMLVFTSSLGSRICAIIVFIVQVILYTFIYLEILEGKEGVEEVDLACSSRPEHTGTQCIAIIIAVITQNDIRMSMNQWNDGYDSVSNAFDGTTKWKYHLASGLRFINGFSSLAVSFFLILSADTVIDLLLNFTAIEVISNLDDAVFIIAADGYFGLGVQKDTNIISATNYYAKPVCHQKGRGNSRIILLFLWLAMTITWIFYLVQLC